MIYKVSAVNDFSEERLNDVYLSLCSGQKEYLDIKPDKHRKQSLCARALLADILGNEVLPLIAFDSKGRLLPLSESKYVSFSHSEELVAVAVSEKPVGIDIQKHRRIREGLFGKAFSVDEQKYVGIDEGRFFKLWTAKEAYVKCFGVSFAEAKKVSFLTDGKFVINNAKCYTESKNDYTLTLVYKENAEI